MRLPHYPESAISSHERYHDLDPQICFQVHRYRRCLSSYLNRRRMGASNSFPQRIAWGVMLTPISHSTVVSVVGHWVDLVETGWLVYSIISHNMHLLLGPSPISSSGNIVCLRVHSSVQTVIFSIMQFCCLTLDEASLSIHSPRMGTIEAVSARE